MLSREYDVGNESDTLNSLWDQERQAYFGVIDAVTGEMSARFGDANMALFLSVGALKPSSAQFLQACALQQLRLLLAVDETTLAVGWLPVLCEEVHSRLYR